MTHRNPFQFLQRIAVLIPCYNEEKTVAQVVRDFLTVLPGAMVYVYDNNSADQTIKRAEEAGAIVRTEKYQGKGNVMRRMFSDIEADIYILVDGDSTYHAASAPDMVDKLLNEQLDMVVGTRLTAHEGDASFRRGHEFGNHMLTGFMSFIFGRQLTDMLSGYRVMSRRFVKSFPALAQGFETETELTIHALELKMPIAEVITPYGSRPVGSESKLSTYRDGWRILLTIVALFNKERPLIFFSLLFGLLAVLSLGLATPVLLTYAQTGLVPRFPTAILATGIMLLACLSLTCGLILDTVTHGRRELKRLNYLSVAALDPEGHGSRGFSAAGQTHLLQQVQISG
jgi:glycosyltransferase involved in cell wall biosynthesis